MTKNNDELQQATETYRDLLISAAYQELGSHKLWESIRQKITTDFNDMAERLRRDPVDSREAFLRVSSCRFLILELLEQFAGHSPNWKILRSRVLRYFGRNGLEKSVLQSLGLQQNSVGGDKW